MSKEIGKIDELKAYPDSTCIMSDGLGIAIKSEVRKLNREMMRMCEDTRLISKKK